MHEPIVRQQMRRPIRDRLAVEQTRAGAGCEQVRDDAQQRGLARAICADDSDQPALTGGQGGVGQNLHCADAGMHPFETDHDAISTPRYAVITFASLHTSRGEPSAILQP